MEQYTLNYHFTSSCNFSCKFCFATFEDLNSATAGLEQSLIALSKIAESGKVNRINFVGGEPTLNMKYLIRLLEHCKLLGLESTIVTNGSNLLRVNKESNLTNLETLVGLVSMIGLSIDSLSPSTNVLTGRAYKGNSLKIIDKDYYNELASSIVELGFALKVNTVVCKTNKDEHNLKDFIREFNIFRWKVFQVKPVLGQNDNYIQDLLISDAEYQNWISNNYIPDVMVCENNDLMDMSYLMLSPTGLLYSETLIGHKYSSKSLFDNSVSFDELFDEIKFNKHKYYERGGEYALPN